MTSQEQDTTQPAQLPVAPHRIRDAALTELGTLTGFVQNLNPTDWTRPHACGDWSVGDVVAHLNLILGLHGRLINAVIAGKGSGSVWRRVGTITQKVMPAASPAINAINRVIPRAMDRALSPEVIKAQFAASARELRETLLRIEPGDYTRPVYYQGGPWPLSFLLGALVDELALHGWDMASKLDPRAHLGDEARGVLPWFFWSGTPFMLRMPKGVTGTIQVSVSDPAAEMWWLVTDARTTQGTGRAGAPDVTITGTSGTLVLTLGGRIPPEDAVRSTSLQITGREELGRALLRSWRIL